MLYHSDLIIEKTFNNTHFFSSSPRAAQWSPGLLSLLIYSLNPQRSRFCPSGSVTQPRISTCIVFCCIMNREVKSSNYLLPLILLNSGLGLHLQHFLALKTNRKRKGVINNKRDEFITTVMWKVTFNKCSGQFHSRLRLQRLHPLYLPHPQAFSQILEWEKCIHT